LLLLGLEAVDPGWHWYEAHLTALQEYVSAGGALVLDQVSVCPPGLRCVNSSIRAFTYVQQSEVDVLPMLLERQVMSNNTGLLQATMYSLNMQRSAPYLADNISDVWLVPHQTHDILYLTLSDQSTRITSSVVLLPGHANKSSVYYNTLTGKIITLPSTITFSDDQPRFLMLAQVPTTINTPSVTFEVSNTTVPRAANCTVTVSVSGLIGLPVQLNVSLAGITRTFSFTSGIPHSLPLTRSNSTLRQFELIAMDSITGKTSLSTAVNVEPMDLSEPSTCAVMFSEQVKAFLNRSSQPLTLALTEEQATNSSFQSLIASVLTMVNEHNRSCSLGLVAPVNSTNDGVVTMLQPLNDMAGHRPQWRTVASDLILLGLPRNNVLMYDQSEGMSALPIRFRMVSYWLSLTRILHA
jgi:hypothetical protein